MPLVDPVADPLDLAPLERSIRASSNFSFACMFYRETAASLATAQGARDALEAIIAVPELHAGLRDTFVKDYRDSFWIRDLEPHAVFVPASGRFENLLAMAAHDHAGAYSRVIRDATPAERAEVAALFGSVGEYVAFELVTSAEAGCATCGYQSHLFSNWFYGTAWDWCFFVAWPKEKLVALVCLTDTD